MYVLKRTDQGGGFVAKPGSRFSYTRKLSNAQKFESWESAKENACGNEIPVDLEMLLDHIRR